MRMVIVRKNELDSPSDIPTDREFVCMLENGDVYEFPLNPLEPPILKADEFAFSLWMDMVENDKYPSAKMVELKRRRRKR